MPGAAWTPEGVEALRGLVKRHGTSWKRVHADAQKDVHLAGRSLQALKRKTENLDNDAAAAMRARRQNDPALREREAAENSCSTTFKSVRSVETGMHSFIRYPASPI